jgi:hypothetical protein
MNISLGIASQGPQRKVAKCEWTRLWHALSQPPDSLFVHAIDGHGSQILDVTNYFIVFDRNTQRVMHSSIHAQDTHTIFSEASVWL